MSEQADAGDDCTTDAECQVSPNLFCDTQDNTCKYYLGASCPAGTGSCADTSLCLGETGVEVCTCGGKESSNDARKKCLSHVGEICRPGTNECIVNAQCTVTTGSGVCICSPGYSIRVKDDYSVCSGATQIFSSAVFVVIALFSQCLL